MIGAFDKDQSAFLYRIEVISMHNMILFYFKTEMLQAVFF